MSSNAERHSRAALMDIYKAEKSWDGWNSDAIAIANDLVNILLQAINSQEPSVWHPSILPLFPDLPARYLASATASARQKLDQLEHKITMMNRQIDRMQTAAESLVKLLPPEGSAAVFVEPLVLGSLTRYADLTQRTCDAYRDAVNMRTEHIDELRRTIQGFEMMEGLTERLDSDMQLVKLSSWLHSPGLKSALLLGPTSTLTISDFDDMLKFELGIEEI
ncbi:hypothetical protein LPJ53_006166 [Coemansia erecta]|uniref:Uncharacterized protein n=1 Tax=Coemansia erecta TaxID=147472 RepID=A0A9W7XTC6_9FUNG|nr:hypothetical protein LPJ53_006166 [Coemansia erecta]